jgi:putative CocE/NonD family hydrolase
LRGSGDSDGVLVDEYLRQEQDDGVASVAWLAAQPWCNGRVGMIGKSWGGFNALQIAARRPPALRAVISVCASDDRYADDAHYMGGALLNENQLWGVVLFNLLSQPPDPALVGERWREMWLERLEKNPLPPLTWLRHPLRDDYWKHGSVAEDYAAVTCPVYAVGGWADAYTNAILRLVAQLKTPCKGLIGPWAHLYPHEGSPGPAIGFLQEALRWWDYWLRDVDTGVMAEPKLRIWMPQPVASRHRGTPGRWIAESMWPSPHLRAERWFLGCDAAQGTLRRTQSEGVALHLRSPQDTGLESGSWCPFGDGGLAGDQTLDDAKSLCFDSAPLPECVELLGSAEAELTVVSEEPAALLAARLNVIEPDGRVTRISYGLLNLTHRDGHAAAEPMPLGPPVTVRVRLNDAAYSLAPGSRLRLAVSTSYWPTVWPSPGTRPVRLLTGQSSLTLPIRSVDPAHDAWQSAFESPESADADVAVELNEVRGVRKTYVDPATGLTRIVVRGGMDEDGTLALSRIDAHGLVTGYGITQTYDIRADDPSLASVQLSYVVRLARDAWSATVKTGLHLTSEGEQLRLTASLCAIEADRETVFERHWDELVPYGRLHGST